MDGLLILPPRQTSSLLGFGPGVGAPGVDFLAAAPVPDNAVWRAVMLPDVLLDGMCDFSGALAELARVMLPDRLFHDPAHGLMRLHRYLMGALRALNEQAAVYGLVPFATAEEHGALVDERAVLPATVYPSVKALCFHTGLVTPSWTPLLCVCAVRGPGGIETPLFAPGRFAAAGWPSSLDGIREVATLALAATGVRPMPFPLRADLRRPCPLLHCVPGELLHLDASLPLEQGIDIVSLLGLVGGVPSADRLAALPEGYRHLTPQEVHDRVTTSVRVVSAMARVKPRVGVPHFVRRPIGAAAAAPSARQLWAPSFTLAAAPGAVTLEPQLLLPLCLDADAAAAGHWRPHAALSVSYDAGSRMYRVHTLLPLEAARDSARQVMVVDADWLLEGLMPVAPAPGASAAVAGSAAADGAAAGGSGGVGVSSGAPTAGGGVAGAGGVGSGSGGVVFGAEGLGPDVAGVSALGAAGLAGGFGGGVGGGGSGSRRTSLLPEGSAAAAAAAAAASASIVSGVGGGGSFFGGALGGSADIVVAGGGGGGDDEDDAGPLPVPLPYDDLDDDYDYGASVGDGHRGGWEECADADAVSGATSIATGESDDGAGGGDDAGTAPAKRQTSTGGGAPASVAGSAAARAAAAAGGGVAAAATATRLPVSAAAGGATAASATTTAKAAGTASLAPKPTSTVDVAYAAATAPGAATASIHWKGTVTGPVEGRDNTWVARCTTTGGRPVDVVFSAAAVHDPDIMHVLRAPSCAGLHVTVVVESSTSRAAARVLPVLYRIQIVEASTAGSGFAKSLTSSLAHEGGPLFFHVSGIRGTDVPVPLIDIPALKGKRAQAMVKNGRYAGQLMACVLYLDGTVAAVPGAKAALAPAPAAAAAAAGGAAAASPCTAAAGVAGTKVPPHASGAASAATGAGAVSLAGGAALSRATSGGSTTSTGSGVLTAAGPGAAAAAAGGLASGAFENIIIKQARAARMAAPTPGKPQRRLGVITSHALSRHAWRARIWMPADPARPTVDTSIEVAFNDDDIEDAELRVAANEYGEDVTGTYVDVAVDSAAPDRATHVKLVWSEGVILRFNPETGRGFGFVSPTVPGAHRPDDVWFHGSCVTDGALDARGRYRSDLAGKKIVFAVRPDSKTSQRPAGSLSAFVATIKG